jgi:nitrate/nitrite transport system permease protein
MSALPRVVAHPSALRMQPKVESPQPSSRLSPKGEGAVPAALSRATAPAWLVRVLAMAAGIAIFVLMWAVVAKFGRIPGPLAVFKEAVAIFSNPFYRNGPNDQGIGWNVLTSLGRVGIGFGLAAAVGIPLGFMIGRFRFLADMAAPIIALLKPVSPPSIYVIFICSLWPMIVNTAVGVRQIPQDYLNVARVLNLSEWKIFTKILFPAVLPYMLTGVRLSIGVAWLVIVAAEMLTGGVGIGFWVWDEWNNLKVDHIIIAIFVIGMVGLLLEQGLIFVARKFSHGVTA